MNKPTPNDVKKRVITFLSKYERIERDKGRNENAKALSLLRRAAEQVKVG